jgi:hypothetical protein
MVTATRAGTAAGIAAKALLLGACGESKETIALAISIAEDAVALVSALAGAGAIEL